MVVSPEEKLLALLNTEAKSEVPKVLKIKNMPSKNPRSPIRFIMNALLAAAV